MKQRFAKCLMTGVMTFVMALVAAPADTFASSPEPPEVELSAPEVGPTEEAADEIWELELAFLKLINYQRAAYRLPPVSFHDEVATAADSHSQDRLRNFGVNDRHPRTGRHIGSDGSNPGNRLDRAGINYSHANEIIAQIISTGTSEGLLLNAKQNAMVGFMASPGHRYAVLDPLFTHAGVGIYETVEIQNRNGRPINVHRFIVTVKFITEA
jgi:uncharacterized protein YkwD